MVKAHARLRQHGFQILHDTLGLLLDRGAHNLAGTWIERNLARGEDHAVYFNGLRVRANGFRS